MCPAERVAQKNAKQPVCSARERPISSLMTPQNVTLRRENWMREQLCKDYLQDRQEWNREISRFWKQ
jgi:hypothetical protein